MTNNLQSNNQQFNDLSKQIKESIEHSNKLRDKLEGGKGITDLIEVRIIRDYANQDGWIAKRLDTNQVCFISNLTEKIKDIQPGDIWIASIQSKGARYTKVYLVEII